jgi:hypothetical protein
MYINDIAEKLISLSRLFADDTSFSYSNRDELQIKTVIDHDLVYILTFAEHSGVCKYLTVYFQYAYSI